MGVVGAAGSEEGQLSWLGRYRKLALRRWHLNQDLMLEIKGRRGKSGSGAL